MSKFLSISLIIVSLVIGVGIGFLISPQYFLMNNNMNSTNVDLGQADKQYDLRFLNAMIAHHMGAIDMATKAKDISQRSEIKNIANNIISAQQKEIDQMYQWKKDWYNDPSKVQLNSYSMNVNLGSYDDKFDLRFINAMTTHHQMAIKMAKDAQSKSVRNEILNLSTGIIAAQTKEIDMMSQWRGSWYSTKINYLTPTTPESSNRNAPTSHAGPVKDQVSFIDELRKETNGMINIGSVINQPFLSVKGTQANIVKLNNADIQIYEYDSNNLMSNEAKQISSDGSSVKTASGSITQIDWNSTPHFYSTGRIMVIYIGTDSQVINILTNILGTQFAGK